MTREEPGGVALVYPYFRSRDPVEKLFPPLGIAFLAAQLRERGVPVTVADCTFEEYDAVVDRVERAEPAIVGVSVMVTMSRNAFDILRSLREPLPEAVFIAGGPLPTLLPRLFSGRFDAVFRGEADIAFPDLCRDLLDSGAGSRFLDGLDPLRYPGIHVEAEGRTVSSLPVHRPAAVLDRLPLPDRSVFDHARYQAVMEESAGMRQTGMMVTRGCPFACDFCSRPVWGSLFRRPSLDRVFTEIAGIAALGYTHLWIADDCFTLDTAFLQKFCRGMIARDVPLGWTCLSRVNGITPALASLMRRGGCVRVYLGLESGSDATLRLMNKRTTVEEGARAVRIFSGAGIGTAGFFMVGYPGETVEDVEKTFAHALALELDEVSFTVPLPLPGTPLFDRVADPAAWVDWEVSNQVRFVYPSSFDEDWLRRRIAETTAAVASRRRRLAALPVDRISSR